MERDRPLTSYGRWVLAAAILGSGMVFLDTTVVTVALPRIGRELPAAMLGVLEGQSYIYNGYLLTLAALLVLAGAANDHYGRKRMFQIGIVGFGVASVLCGFATTMEMLVVFRILQGAAGALLVPSSLSLITACFDDQVQRGRAFGFWSGASAATTILVLPKAVQTSRLVEVDSTSSTSPRGRCARSAPSRADGPRCRSSREVAS